MSPSKVAAFLSAVVFDERMREGKMVFIKD